MKHRRIVVILLAVAATAPALSQVDRLTWEAQPSAIVFSHALHVTDQELECVTCHEGALASTVATDRLFPEMDVCADCHDIEDDEACGTCHRDPEDLQASAHPERPVAFSHQAHVESGATCGTCHGGIASNQGGNTGDLPDMTLCMGCHDGLKASKRCDLCHGDRVTLADIHPDDWRRMHGDAAAQDNSSCAGCHQNRVACLECHRGDNLTGWIHDLNYNLTHGLDAGSKEAVCARCHDRRLFCNDCHESLNRIPLDHSQLSWMWDHGQASRNDTERCQACHDTADPTCARAGCHADFDGLRGTDQMIHPPDVGRFDREGPWHEDPTYFCYQCHTNTGTVGSGFCGYCHD